ncbi:brain natriuretic peptide [Sigmodon hispidus]
MDLQKLLSQMILFLLFLYLSPLACRSHPVSSPSQSPQQFRMQTLLDLLREKADDRAREQLLKDQDSTKAPSRSTLQSQDSTFQILQSLQKSKKMYSSACFGHRIDRIGSVSRLGCNVLKQH